MSNISVKWLSNKIKATNRNEIFNQMVALIKSGKIPVGSLLPNITELANELGFSVGNISSVWSLLREQNLVSYIPQKGVIVTANSTFVLPKELLTLILIITILSLT